jgi:hypothetical protein
LPERRRINAFQQGLIGVEDYTVTSAIHPINVVLAKQITFVRKGKAAPRSDSHTPITWERLPEARVLSCIE